MIDNSKRRLEQVANIKEWALCYLNDWKFSIVPAKTIEKAGTYVGWKQYQSKKPTEQEIHDWWGRYSNAGIAIVTGQINGIIVLDIDPRHGGDKTIEDKELPKTWTVKTGGGGLHYYYRYPDIDTEIKNFTGDSVGLQGVDLRADGGMVYAPPSVHPSGDNYEFMEGLSPNDVELSDPPEWLMEVIIRQNQPKNSINKTNTNWIEKWIGVKEGSRNNTCSQLAGKLAYAEVPIDVAKDLLLHQWNELNKDIEGNANPLAKKELLQTVDNIYKAHQKDNKKDEDSEGFHPSEVADKVFKWGEKQGHFWCYVPESEVMYSYKQKDGYWKKSNIEYLKSTIRNVLNMLNKDWDTSYYIKETLKALKHRRIDEKNYKIFNDISKLDLNHINIRSGMLDWKTGGLKKHSPEYYSVFQIPVEYDLEVDCPNWKKAMRDWIPSADTRKFLQEFVGYCLIPDTSQQKALILQGAGSNGKSTFLEVLGELFGEENLTNIPLQKLGAKFETAYVNHSLVNICSDIDPTYLKETGVVKTMIGGEKLRGEHKYGNSFDFRSVTRLMFSTNELPKTRDKTDGWYRRFEVVNFPNRFSPDDPNFDPDLKKKLRKELNGIFKWALKGLRRYNQNGGFTKSKDLERAKNRYKCENDSVRMFAEEMLKKVELDEPRFTIPKKHLYDRYKRYCDEAGLGAKVTRRNFTSRLKDLGFEEAKRRATLSKKKIFDDLPDFLHSDEEETSKSQRCFIKMQLIPEG